MLVIWLYLFLLLIIIVISAQLFTNALEHVGHKLGLSAGVTGSIFAAIATALPETLIPILAIVAGTANVQINQEISVGAILGAPLMLSTLSIFLMALSVIKKRGMAGKIKPESKGTIRDLQFFLSAFFLAASALYVPEKMFVLRLSCSFLLIILYGYYLILTINASTHLVKQGHGVLPDSALYLTKFGLKNNLGTMLLQLILALIILLFAAKGFIERVTLISQLLNVSALLLSLIIIPIATELPEKVNSILWIRKNKDTLAMGNITGAMVFQGTLLPALGILLTPWVPNKEVVLGMAITLLAALSLRLNITRHGLAIPAIFINGGLYVLYLYLVFNS